MPKIPTIIADYIAAQPEEMQPALRELHALFAQTYPRARVEMMPTGKGELPTYKDGDTFLGGFSVRARGPMVYVSDVEVVARHKPQLGSLAPPGNGACVLYKPTKNLDAAALKALVAQMLSEAEARK